VQMGKVFSPKRNFLFSDRQILNTEKSCKKPWGIQWASELDSHMGNGVCMRLGNGGGGLKKELFTGMVRIGTK
jgi:hypothetical protein